jgi:predicted porin
MKKSLIAAALAAAVAAPAANASVSIYGKVHLSIDYFDDEGGSDQGWYVQSRSSYIGFKGTEDLGNGLSLIWKAETEYDFADGDAWSGNRDAYIGLTGSWGTFIYGNTDTPMTMSTAQFDLFEDTIADHEADGDAMDEEHWDNLITYISPNMNGLTIAAAIAPGEGEDGETGLADNYSIAAMYSNNGLSLTAAYEKEIGDTDTWSVGAGYTINNVTLNAVYQDEVDDEVTWTISGAYGFGNNTVKARYLSEDDGDDHMWAVGLDHNLSKRSKVYAIYATGDDTDLHSYDDDGYGLEVDPAFWTVA